jgi:hypothetical protein
VQFPIGAVLQHSSTPVLQHSNTPILQYSNTPILQYSAWPDSRTRTTTRTRTKRLTRATDGVVLFLIGSAYRYHDDNRINNHPQRRSFRATKHDVTIEAPFGRPFRAGLFWAIPRAKALGCSVFALRAKAGARALICISVSLSGCARIGSYAPSLDVYGSYFPAWLICLIVGVILTVLASQIGRFLNLSQLRKFGPLIPISLILIFSIATWFLFFAS